MFVPHKILATGSASQGGVGGGSGGGLEAAGAMDNLSINKEYYGDPAAGNYSDVSLEIKFLLSSIIFAQSGYSEFSNVLRVKCGKFVAYQKDWKHPC